MQKKLADFFQKYRHGLWIVAYMVFYLLGFYVLEHATHRHYHVIHSVIDDMIPFCEIFVIPYFLWFAFVAGSICWFIFFGKNRMEYDKLSCALAIGMTIFLIVSCIYPNMQDLRPEVFARDNLLVRAVQRLYSTDTPTNVLPSIHVYNSLIIFYAINDCEQLRPYKKVRASCGILAILIVLSTMFLKQHSVVDVSMGILMSFAVQMFCDRVFQEEEEYANTI